MTKFYIVPEFNHLEETERYAREQELFFEYNDFFSPEILENESVIEERIAAYRTLGRDCTEDTMHGAFFDVTVFSYDRRIREISFHRMRQSVEIAKKMGLRAVIFHGNYLPFLRGERYDTNWLQRTEEAVRTLCKEYPEVQIYIENMFEDSPELMEKLAIRMRDVSTFGICLDYSHALLTSENGEPWFSCLSPFIRHIHVNDHCFSGDAHMIPGEGRTDWDEFFRLKKQYAPEATVLCEVTGLEAAKRGIKFLRSKIADFESQNA